MSSLEQSDAEAAAVQKTPNRVTLKDIENSIGFEWRFNAYETGMRAFGEGASPLPDALKVLTVCILVTKNGFTVVGKSAPADSGNFDAALGAKFAREDCIRQLWPLMGFALREKLRAAQP